MKTEDKRIEFIDIFRGIGIILMIMGHIGFGKRFDIFIHAFHMPMFFIVTGLLWDEKNFSSKSSFEFIKHSAKSLLVPYAFFGAFHLLLSGALNSWEDILPGLKALLLYNTSGGMPIAGALWFLTSLFFAKLFVFFLDKLIDDKPVKLSVAALACIAGNSCGQRLPLAMGASLVGIGLIYIGRGIRNKNFADIPFTVNSAAVVFVSGILVTFLIFKFGYVNMRAGTYPSIPMFWINAVSASVIGIVISSWISRIKTVSWYLQTVGRTSIVYVCLNQAIILIFEKLLNEYGAAGTVRWYLFRLAVLSAVLAILFVISLIIDKTPLKAVLGKGKVRAVLIISVLMVLAGLSIPHIQKIKKESEYKALYVNVKSPVMEEGFSGTDYSDILREGERFIIDEWWYDQGDYAYSGSSSISKGLTELSEEQITDRDISIDSFINWEKDGYLHIANGINSKYQENAIRPLAHNCFSMSVLIKSGISVSEESRLKTEKLITSLAACHLANCNNGWGQQWQSALWAENIGFAAWLLWDDFNEADRLNITRMIINEADYKSVDYTVPYYADAEEIFYEGDTKGEENAWNSRILALAAGMYPSHKNRELWEEKLKELLISSTAIPEDNLKRYNMNSDGTVVNHGQYHIDYMAVIEEGMIDTVLIYTLAGRQFPAEAVHNFDIIYNALVDLDIGKYDIEKSGHHFYERDENGHAGKEVNMPGENDWGGSWYPLYYLTDVIADKFGFDTACGSGLKAADWASVHLDAVKEMVNRDDGSLGCFFIDGENDFCSGEAYMLQNMCKAYLLELLL